MTRGVYKKLREASAAGGGRGSAGKCSKAAVRCGHIPTVRRSLSTRISTRASQVQVCEKLPGRILYYNPPAKLEDLAGPEGRQRAATLWLVRVRGMAEAGLGRRRVGTGTIAFCVVCSPNLAWGRAILILRADRNKEAMVVPTVGRRKWSGSCYSIYAET